MDTIENLYQSSLKIKSDYARIKELEDIESRFENILKKEDLTHLNISIVIDRMRTKGKKFNAYAKMLEDDSYCKPPQKPYYLKQNSSFLNRI
jgi:hypothetical protein